MVGWFQAVGKKMTVYFIFCWFVCLFCLCTTAVDALWGLIVTPETENLCLKWQRIIKHSSISLYVPPSPRMPKQKWPFCIIFSTEKCLHTFPSESAHVVCL